MAIKNRAIVLNMSFQMKYPFDMNLENTLFKLPRLIDEVYELKISFTRNGEFISYISAYGVHPIFNLQRQENETLAETVEVMLNLIKKNNV